MLEAVKILNSHDTDALTKAILKFVNEQGYELVGPVSTSVTLGNDFRYTATLVKRDNKETK